MLDVLRFGRLLPNPISGMIVERSSIRGFAADYPILIFFKPSHLVMFHTYVVVIRL